MRYCLHNFVQWHFTRTLPYLPLEVLSHTLPSQTYLPATNNNSGTAVAKEACGNNVIDTGIVLTVQGAQFTAYAQDTI